MPIGFGIHGAVRVKRLPTADVNGEDPILALLKLEEGTSVYKEEIKEI